MIPLLSDSVTPPTTCALTFPGTLMNAGPAPQQYGTKTLYLRQILVFGLLTLDITLLCGNVEMVHVRNHVRGLLVGSPPRHVWHAGFDWRALTGAGGGFRIILCSHVGERCIECL